MVVGLDIDETISRHPQFFALLSRALVDAGHRVVIITFREDRDRAGKDLEGWGIAYTTLVTSTLDQHLEHGVDEWKAWVCREHGVEVFFDDSPEVLRHVDGSVLCLMAVDQEVHDLGKLSEESKPA